MQKIFYVIKSKVLKTNWYISEFFDVMFIKLQTHLYGFFFWKFLLKILKHRIFVVKFSKIFLLQDRCRSHDQRSRISFKLDNMESKNCRYEKKKFFFKFMKKFFWPPGNIFRGIDQQRATRENQVLSSWSPYINPFATRHAYMRQLFHCLQWYAGSERVNHTCFTLVVLLKHKLMVLIKTKQKRNRKQCTTTRDHSFAAILIYTQHPRQKSYTPALYSLTYPNPGTKQQ